MSKAPRKATRLRARARRGTPSITERADGRWSLTVELPRGTDGRRRRHQSTHKTYEEALQASRQIDHSALPLTRAEQDLTVAQLMTLWLSRQAPAEHSTAENRSWLAATVTAHLGNLKVSRLSKADVESFRQQMQLAGRSPSTINKCLQRLKAALSLALDAGITRTNAAQGVAPARTSGGRRVLPWSDEDVQAILQASTSSPLRVPVLVAFTTGARLGELLGAQLGDYDPATGTLRINGTAKKNGGRGQPKTAAAFRSLPLPEEVQKHLLQHLEEVAARKALAGGAWGTRRAVSEATRQKQRQAALARSGRPLGDSWRPPAPAPAPFTPLFPTSHGTPWSLRNAQREWARILQVAGLAHQNFHTIRSHFATEALQGGAMVREVQDVMGHSSPLMTLHYQRSVPGSERQVIGTVARRLGLQGGAPAPAEPPEVE